MRENAVQELVQDGTVTIEHIPGSINLSDLFNKEMKDTTHFITLVDLIMYDPNMPTQQTDISSININPSTSAVIGGVSTTVPTRTT